MTSVLDRTQEEEVANLLLGMMDEAGYTPEEFIPGLVVAARLLAIKSNSEDQVLDEAVEILEEEQGEDYE